MSDSGPTAGWTQRKLDGQRCLAVRDSDGTRLYSRSGRNVTVAFPEIAEALEEQASANFVIDGEVVAFEGRRTSFARLQPRIHLNSEDKARRTGIAVFFYVFDVLRADGEDIRSRSLLDRKRVLRALLTFDGPVRLTPYRVSADEDYFAEACRKGWEGLHRQASRGDVRDRSDHRLAEVQISRQAGQELVVVGWTDPRGPGSLWGRCCSATTATTTWSTPARSAPASPRTCCGTSSVGSSSLAVDESPCTAGNLPRKAVHWVRPELVAEVAFTEWTSAGQLRHPRLPRATD